MVKKADRKTGSIKNLLPFSLRKKNLKYQKLPAHLLKLSVVKLDGSSFSFQVPRNASVARLRLAIEEEFSLAHNCSGKPHWPLVWSHFCLNYEGQKLISDKACIDSFGIKDGDQLHFMQHMRIDEAPEWQSAEYGQQHLTHNEATLTHSLKKLILPCNFRRSRSI